MCVCFNNVCLFVCLSVIKCCKLRFIYKNAVDPTKVGISHSWALVSSQIENLRLVIVLYAGQVNFHNL